ncbi:HERC1 [Symbiodinium sp. KB8]|nr:HERC1 [Symbiodinium sp. KB8]
MDGAITSGKWMWEAKVLSVQGHVVVGMATRGAVVRNHLGCERQSWGFKSNRECFHKGSSKPYGKPFSGGDVIGVEVDMDNGTIEWLVNGTGLGIAYTDLRAQAMEHSSVCHIPDGKGVVPGLTTYAQGDAVKLLGLKSGHGVRTWSEEDSLSGVRRRYEGQWHLGQMHGLGELTVAGDEAGTWSGYWLAGIQQGVHKWVPSSGADGDAEPTPKYFKFEDGVKGEEVDEAACSADHEQRAGAVAKSLDEAKLAANSAPRPKPRVAPIRGSFQADQDTPFVWMKSVAGRSINVTDDLKKVSHSRSSSGMIMGSRGFSGGVHYWEVYLKAEFTDEGRMLHEQLMTNSGGAMLYVGVAERRVSDAESWRDYGYMNYMAVKSSFQSERLYGQHMMPNDRIGVLLNMDEGTLTFTRDGEMFGEFKYDNFGPAFRYIRSGTRGGPTSRVLYPIIGLSSPADPVTLADTKWLSIPAVPPAAHLDSVLEAATLLQRWDRPAAARARIPEALRAESYSRWLSMSAGHHVQATTRIGVAVAYDRSTTACAAVLARLGKAGKALRGGDRVTFQGKGSTIVGVYRQRLWYRKDGDAEAWYFKADDLNEVAVHARPADVQAEEDRELAAEAAADAAWKAAIEAGSTPVKASLAATKGADMTREAFDALLDDDRWTIAADMALVRLVNMQCDESGVEPENLALRPAAREEGHPAWMSESSNLSLMQARFAVLLRLNARLKGLLPLVDLTVSRPHLVAAHAGKISYPSALGRRVAALRGLAFTRTKLQHWRRVLAATVLYTEPAGENFMRASSVPELSVNRVKAHVLKLKQIPSHKERMRTSVFGQLMSQVKGWEAAQFRRDYSYEADLGQQRNFFVKLDNEGVDDNGGPYRQVIETALRSEAPGPLGLLVPCQNAVLGKGGNRDKLVFAGVSDEEVAEIARASSGSRTSDSDALAAAAKEATLARKRALRFLGVLAGTALRHDALMGVNLPALVWRPLVGQPVSEREVFELDHDFSSAIAHLRALQPPAEGASAEERALAERALTESAVAAVGCVRDDDASRKARLERAAQRLSFAKREPFVKAVIEAAARATEAPLLPFMHGLGSVVPHELLPMWTHEELETLLAGRPHVDVGLLERVVRYDGGFDSAHPTIVALWKVLRSMPQSMLRKFLDFVSARQRLPASPDGFLQPFKVVSLGAEAAQQGKLPKGISCFFTLQLPEYTDEDTLRAKLELGILNSWTMDADWQVGSRAGVMEGFDFMDVVEEGDEAEEGGGAAASRAD